MLITILEALPLGVKTLVTRARSALLEAMGKQEVGSEAQ